MNDDKKVPDQATENSQKDIEKEIEELDQFLKDADDFSEDDFEMNDTDELPLTAGTGIENGERQTKTSGGAGKFVGYFVFLLVLGGIGYAAMVYLPAYLNSRTLTDLETMVENRENDIQGMMDQTSTDAQPADMPVPMDMQDESMPADLADEEAPTIAEALDMAQNETANIGEENAVTEDPLMQENGEDATAAPVEPVMVEEVDGLEAPVEEVAVDNSLGVMPAAPLDVVDQSASLEETDEENLPPLDENTVDIADDVMSSPAVEPQPLQEMVDSSEVEATQNDVETTEEASTETVMVDDAVVSESEPTMMEEVAEEMPAPARIEEETVATPEVIEPVVVAEQKTEAVQQPKTKPAEVKVQPQVKEEPQEAKPAIRTADQLTGSSDPRILEGQMALSKGDFTTATRIFSAVLATDPSNVHALTGKQKAMSGIRVPAPQMPQPTVTAPVIAPSTSSIPTAPSQQSMPMDGNAAAPVQETNPDLSFPMNDIQWKGERIRPSNVPTAPSAPATAPATVSTPPAVAPTMPQAQNVQGLLQQFSADQQNARLALQIADSFRASGDTVQAEQWYKKALQLDVIYKAGLDRMRIYQSMADMK